MIDNFETVNNHFIYSFLSVLLFYRDFRILQLDYHFLEDVLQSKLRGKRLLKSSGVYVFFATNNGLILKFAVCLLMSLFTIRSIVDPGKYRPKKEGERW